MNSAPAVSGAALDHPATARVPQRTPASREEAAAAFCVDSAALACLVLAFVRFFSSPPWSRVSAEVGALHGLRAAAAGPTGLAARPGLGPQAEEARAPAFGGADMSVVLLDVVSDDETGTYFSSAFRLRSKCLCDNDSGGRIWSFQTMTTASLRRGRRGPRAERAWAAPHFTARRAD